MVLLGIVQAEMVVEVASQWESVLTLVALVCLISCIPADMPVQLVLECKGYLATFTMQPLVDIVGSQVLS